jgi:hypothetical protein
VSGLVSVLNKGTGERSCEKLFRSSEEASVGSGSARVDHGQRRRGELVFIPCTSGAHDSSAHDSSGNVCEDLEEPNAKATGPNVKNLEISR